MKKNKPLLVSILLASLISAIGFGLSTWKMLEFKERLHNIIDNKKWEAHLESEIEKPLDDNLIVFFGDSQIDLWWMGTSFGVLPIKNRGKSGDWASTGVSRFQKDVVDLNPKIAVILIGTNDLGNNQPIHSIIDPIETMVKKATDHKIKVVLCSLLPVRGAHVLNHSKESLQKVNNELREVGVRNGAEFVDFYSGLVDDEGLFKNEYTTDGLHPSKRGYAKMAKIIYPILIQNIATKEIPDPELALNSQ